MNDEAKQPATVSAGSGSVQLIAAIILVVGGVVGFYLFKSRPEAWLSWVVLFGGLLLGVLVFAFWPKRQETFTTTLVVLVFVVIASTFFWLLDLLLASATRFFTGQGS